MIFFDDSVLKIGSQLLSEDGEQLKVLIALE